MKFSVSDNYEKTRAAVGYLRQAEASAETYAALGFMSGLEIHQQLKTEKKLFCRCPVGIYQAGDDYDVEVLRHMRPTLSEMGGYDGTALMERRTRKNIFYRLKGETACTYEIDDTPPFPLNREALKIAIEIALLLKGNIVGELHITRKQYLDGSIPTGFQRTAIVGVGGEISLPNKTIRMIQLSLEEDSCREVSDIGHDRIYRTDRLGTPLIEMVTHPEMLTPAEVAEAAEYLSYLSRSTGHVRTGIGAARQDVNVSITGGTRIEIKGVAHIAWIERLTHIEAYRQKALLTIAEKLSDRVADKDRWRATYHDLELKALPDSSWPEAIRLAQPERIRAVRLPGFQGILSHFTQPGKVFADEFAERLKVIACLDQPNMIHTEELEPSLPPSQLLSLAEAEPQDAVIVIWGDTADVEEAWLTIEERCQMAFEGVPNETRKSLPNGNSMFERVLPGSDRMYPDTDSAPIKIGQELVDQITEGLPKEISYYQALLSDWQVSLDVKRYLLRSNLMPMAEKIIADLSLEGKWVACLLAHRVKSMRKKFPGADLSQERIYNLIKFLVDNSLQPELVKRLLPAMFAEPGFSHEKLLATCSLVAMTDEQVKQKIDSLVDEFSLNQRSDKDQARARWIMGRLAPGLMGQMAMKDLQQLTGATAGDNG